MNDNIKFNYKDIIEIIIVNKLINLSINNKLNYYKLLKFKY